MKSLRLPILWQRLVAEGTTCPRCGATEVEVEQAVATLTAALAPLGIEVVLEKKALSIEAFRQDAMQSNEIRLNGRLLEEWLGAKTGQSECCAVCGPSDCRTIEVQGAVYETVAADLVVRAGLLAAAALMGQSVCGCSPGSDGCCLP